MLYLFNPSLAYPLNLIHPLQVKKVSALLALAMPRALRHLIVFGSSLDLTHGPHSDLDLYAIADPAALENVRAWLYGACKDLRIKADILAATREAFLDDMREPGTVESRILQKGVCVYAAP